MQVAIYARVSTGRQAENELSIPDQLRQMRQWAERSGHIVAKEYIEPGNTATDDKRPVFQDMMLDAEQKPAPFQLIVVHSFSRFFRDMVEAALYEKKLGKSGIKLVSITQHIADDAAGEMQKRIIMMFDEYQSKENAKHTLRGMQENARQGYFNGSRAPFGYKTIAAGQTGVHGRIKKKLAIEDSEAAIVKDIFALYVHGINSPRMGMKEIAKHLNQRNLTMRGKPWRIQKIHDMLSSTTYAGWHVFNRTDSKSFKRKDESEWVKVPVPVIIDQELFDKVTKLRSVLTPMKSAPRRENSPNLLTGLLHCGCCGATMVKITAKNNRYRYYKCSSRISQGNTVCKSPNFPMEKLDNLVLQAFKDKIYTSDHIHAVIDTMRSHAKHHDGEDKHRIKKLETEAKEIEQAENKLYEAIEKGILELDDKLKTRVRQHKARQEAIATELATLHRQHQTPMQTLTPQKIEAISRVLNKRFATSMPFSRAYLKATVKEITVTDDLLKLTGENKTLAALIASNGIIDPNAVVHRFIPDWRPLVDAIGTHFSEDVLNFHKVLLV
jgi:DNA invertase Pin-like site-specific DNA recombinase